MKKRYEVVLDGSAENPTLEKKRDFIETDGHRSPKIGEKAWAKFPGIGGSILATITDVKEVKD